MKIPPPAAIPRLEPYRRHRHLSYVLLLATVVLLVAALLVSYTKEFYHRPQIAISPDGELYAFEAATVHDDAGRTYFLAGPRAPAQDLPLSGAILLPAGDDTLFVTRGAISLRGRTERSRPLGIDAVPAAAAPEGDEIIRFWGLRPGSGGLITWTVRWSDLREPSRDPPAILDPEIVAAQARVAPPVWPLTLNGRPHVIWRSAETGEAHLLRRGDQGWEEVATDRLVGPFAVFAAQARVWLVEPVRQIGKAGRLTLRVRAFGSDRTVDLVWTERRLFGKRVTGLAAIARPEGVEILQTRTSAVQKLMIRPAQEGEWSPHGPIQTLRSRPAWRIAADLLSVPLLLLVSLPLMAVGARMMRERRRILRQLLRLPESTHRFAGVWERSIAYFIDVMLLAPSGIVLIEFLELEPTLGGARGWQTTAAVTGLAAALQFLYFFPMEWIAGQTVGKKLVGIRVEGPDGSAPGLGRALVRNLLRVLDSFHLLCLVGLTVILATPRRQRIGDLIARTVVVPEAPSDEDLLQETLSS